MVFISGVFAEALASTSMSRHAGNAALSPDNLNLEKLAVLALVATKMPQLRRHARHVALDSENLSLEQLVVLGPAAR